MFKGEECAMTKAADVVYQQLLDKAVNEKLDDKKRTFIALELGQPVPQVEDSDQYKKLFSDFVRGEFAETEKLKAR